MNDDSSQAGPCGEVSTFAARSMVSPGLQAVLKASTDARFGPLMADVSKTFLGVGLPRPELGGFAKLAAGRWSDRGSRPPSRRPPTPGTGR
jgi:hypothetical protein